MKNISIAKVKKEVIIDGYAGFIMLDKNQNPKVALHLENEMRWALKKYKKLYSETPLPHITPHVFRHTILYEHGECRNGFEKFAILNGTF